MTDEQMAKALNEWMRRYIDEPDRFIAEFKTVMDFLQQEASGQEPSYGDHCVAYMHEISASLEAE
jgi:hypothetical protein